LNIKEKLTAAIIEKEWEMFRDVPNAGGKAACQEDFYTFQIMRSSQAASWSEATLESYLSDLKEAGGMGRNLLTEKYARMMQTTWTSEYNRIKDLLPVVDSRAIELIERIVPVVLTWEEELIKKFPHILKRGRPLFSREDAPGVTSFETYFRAELATYSPKTLALYQANILQQLSAGINGSEITLANMMHRYGFGSLEETNATLKGRD
jgi:hypothetical protein